MYREEEGGGSRERGDRAQWTRGSGRKWVAPRDVHPGLSTGPREPLPSAETRDRGLTRVSASSARLELPLADTSVMEDSGHPQNVALGCWK